MKRYRWMLGLMVMLGSIVSSSGVLIGLLALRQRYQSWLYSISWYPNWAAKWKGVGTYGSAVGVSLMVLVAGIAWGVKIIQGDKPPESD